MNVPFVGAAKIPGGPAVPAVSIPVKAPVSDAAQSGVVSAFEGMFRDFGGGPEVAVQPTPRWSAPQRSAPGPKVSVPDVPTKQAVPQQAVPQQAVPQQAVPQQAVPQQAVPQQEVRQQDVRLQQDALDKRVSPGSVAQDSVAQGSVPAQQNAADSRISSNPQAAPVEAGPEFEFVGQKPGGRAEAPAHETGSHKDKGTRKAAVKEGAASARPEAPAVSVAVPVPIPAVEPSKQPAPKAADAAAPVVPTKSDSPAEHAPTPDTILHVTLRTAAPVAPEPPTAAKQEVPRAVAEIPVTPAPAPPPAPAPVHAEANLPATPAAPPASPQPAREAKAPAEPALPPEAPQQQIKSVSLEFTPDGAGDVRLRVTERAGEVHISLHSTDASLSGKLHEGVHDLVGSLSTAGYDAEAWTPGQGHQGGQQNEQRRPQRPQAGEDGAEEFSGMFEEPIQEVS